MTTTKSRFEWLSDGTGWSEVSPHAAAFAVISDYILAAESQIAEMRKELATERDVIEEMRTRAYRARVDINAALFEI
jgi:uncharacterized membrane protein (GlpM family)